MEVSNSGAICSTYEVTEVLIAVGMTAGVVFALTLFAMQTKIDFTAWGGGTLTLTHVKINSCSCYPKCGVQVHCSVFWWSLFWQASLLPSSHRYLC